MRLFAALVLLLSAAALAVFAASFAVDTVERTTRDQVAGALGGDYRWAQTRVDGLQVVMTGTAPDEAARFAAISSVGGAIDAARIVDRIEVTPATAIAPPPFSVEILRNADGISLIGLVPAATDRAGILDRLGRITEGPVTDLMETGDYPTPAAWDPALEFALTALAEVPRSKVSVTAARVAVTGIVDSARTKRKVEGDLARALPEGVRLALDIRAPRPVIAPFTLRFVRDPDGSARFDACAADTVEAERAILAAAGKAGLRGKVPCTIGLGAPSAEWGRAVSEAILAFGRIGAGKLTVTDGDVSLVAPAGVDGRLFDREVGELGRALPGGFSLTAVQTPAPEPEGGATPEAHEGPAEFVATLDQDGKVDLRGRLPDERAQEAVESYAHGHFGVDRTYAATRVADELPRGWGLRAMAALDALSWLAEGKVVVKPDLLTVTGDTGHPDAQAEIAGMLGERLGDGANFEIDVRYLETLDPDSGKPTAEECVARLSTVQSVRKVTFEPGSSTIDKDGAQIVAQLADILRDCPTVPMEIAGHTDSQGRETMNLELSQARADAVLNALMARRVLTANLVAKGYGETRPIADNGTEAGREANRRIEFTLKGVGEEAAAVDPVKGADVTGEAVMRDDAADGGAGDAGAGDAGGEKAADGQN